jgi:hypothetical protein
MYSIPPEDTGWEMTMSEDLGPAISASLEAHVWVTDAQGQTVADYTYTEPANLAVNDGSYFYLNATGGPGFNEFVANAASVLSGTASATPHLVIGVTLTFDPENPPPDATVIDASTYLSGYSLPMARNGAPPKIKTW